MSLVNKNHRSAISEIAYAQRPTGEHRSHSKLYSHRVGIGTEGDDDETKGNDNEVVDLADETPYVIPYTQIRKENGNIGKGKAVVVFDSQSGGEDNKNKCRGVRMEEYGNRRP